MLICIGGLGILVGRSIEAEMLTKLDVPLSSRVVMDFLIFLIANISTDNGL